MGETPVAANVLRGPGAVGARDLVEWINARVAASGSRWLYFGSAP